MAVGKKKDQDDPQDLIARKEYKKAIPIIRDRLDKQPRNAALKLGLAEALFANGQTEEAISEYKDLAALLAEAGYIVKAIAVYKKILKLNPNLTEIELMLSNLSEKRVTESGSHRPIKTSEATKQTAEEAPAISPHREIETKLFKDLTAEEFRQIVSKLALRHYEEDTIVVKEGDPGDSMFIVVTGEVKVLTHDAQRKEVTLASLGEGEFFGEISLLTSKPRTATIITNIDSELLELTRQDYEKIAARYPHVKGVMQEFHEQRAYKTIEAMIQTLQSRQ